MIKLHELKNTPGAKKSRQRVGRGDSSGWGRTCGRGEKGQKSRSGSTSRPHFEGGQIPLFRRLPKRGFKSRNRVAYNLINLSALEKNFAAGDVVDETTLKEKHLLGKSDLGLKILGNGDLTLALTVKAKKFSATAQEKIEKAGGTCEVV
jgi:large subunit ribosomal protein L15